MSTTTAALSEVAASPGPASPPPMDPRRQQKRSLASLAMSEGLAGGHGTAGLVGNITSGGRINPFLAYQNDVSQAGDLSSCALVLMLEGIPKDFAFSENDLWATFSRYGPLKTVQLLDSVSAPDVALLEFQNNSDAYECQRHLDGTVLKIEGDTCVARVKQFSQEMEKHLRGLLETAAAASLQYQVARDGESILSDPEALGGPAANAGKWCARFVIGAERMHKDFPIVGRIIGPNGEHMKLIHHKTGAKLRLRGRRSNFREGPENKESDEPLHLCVSSHDEVSYRRTCEMVEHLMKGVYHDYGEWCAQRGIPIPAIQMIMVEGSTHESLEEKLQELYSSQNLTIPSPGSVEEEGDKAVDPRLAEAHLPIFDASQTGPAYKRIRSDINSVSKVCRHWLRGQCHYGDRCSFRHVVPPGMAPPPQGVVFIQQPSGDDDKPAGPS